VLRSRLWDIPAKETLRRLIAEHPGWLLQAVQRHVIKIFFV
jgi:hypothetical protein